MDPAIGAALIGLGAAAAGVSGIVIGVYLTARRAQDQKRQELVASALSDYMRAAAQSVTALALEEYARSLSDEARRETVAKEALDVRRRALETTAEAKVRLLTFADSDVLESLARWDRDAVAVDPHQQRALLAVVDSVRRQLVGSKAASVPEPDRLGLMFGWSDEHHRATGTSTARPKGT
ncbi:MAG: hypothetical protein ACLP8S_29560 [Solirubrobacteraceae bacterium]